MKQRIMSIFLAMAFLLGTGTVISTPTASANQAPSYGYICGGGTWSLAGHMDASYTYQSGTTFCAVTINPQWGTRVMLSATISRNSISVRDAGDFLNYAGPVKMSLSTGRCATVSYSARYNSLDTTYIGRYTVCNG